MTVFCSAQPYIPGSKASVRKLHETVDRMISSGLVPVEVLSIVDPDSDIWSREIRAKGNNLEWTVYHIENYLLNVTYIKQALDVVKLEGASRLTGIQIEKWLEDAAEDLIETLALPWAARAARPGRSTSPATATGSGPASTTKSAS